MKTKTKNKYYVELTDSYKGITRVTYFGREEYPVCFKQNLTPLYGAKAAIRKKKHVIKIYGRMTSFVGAALIKIPTKQKRARIKKRLGHPLKSAVRRKFV